ncbi:hypothetical protein ABID28_000874 [Streptococcus porcorum]|uniref:Phage protein n=1 Tax=Streptococcus porcorum TaxID=701526 RepID=A0ABV2JEP1_9STRE
MLKDLLEILFIITLTGVGVWSCVQLIRIFEHHMEDV